MQKLQPLIIQSFFVKKREQTQLLPDCQTNVINTNAPLELLTVTFNG